MLKQISAMLLMAAILIFSSCSSDSSSPEIEENPFEPIAPVNPQDKADRMFGITVSESSNGFLTDFAVARQAGIQTAELGLSWDSVETSEGVYQDPDGVLAAMAFYEANDISLMLTFAVINTVQRTTPDYLDGYAWDAPELITAFNNMASWVFEQLPENLDVVGVSIGNEVNYVLQHDEWTPYGVFFQAGANHLHTIDATLSVGVKTTVRDGLFSSAVGNIKQLNQLTDVVMLNFYMMNTAFEVIDPIQVYDDFTLMVNSFPGREIWLTEVGYQSGSQYCQSSEDLQAAFYHGMFTAWDYHRHEIQYVMVDWLNDASAQQLTDWEHYYQSSSPAFLEYLGTLGLRTNAGEDKNAWIQLLVEANARGWTDGGS